MHAHSVILKRNYVITEIIAKLINILKLMFVVKKKKLAVYFKCSVIYNLRHKRTSS